MSAVEENIEISAVNIEDCSNDVDLLEAFARTETHHPQFGLDWLQNLSRHGLDPGEHGVVYLARINADNFLALPLVLSDKTRQARSLSTFYTSLYSPVMRGESFEKLSLALLQHLLRVAGITTLVLSPLDADTPLFTGLKRSMTRAGFSAVHEFFCFANWTHTLPETDFKTYLDGRPSRLRNTIRRRTRAFLENEMGALEIVTGGEELKGAIEHYTAVYNNSWKQAEPYPEFIPQMLQLAARRGWLRLGIAKCGNTPVAGQIWLVSQDTAYIFKLAYDENFSRLSPGTVLTAFMMEQVINNEAISRLDYLSGDDAYKSDWMTQRYLRRGLAGYNSHTLRGASMALAHTVKAAVRGRAQD